MSNESDIEHLPSVSAVITTRNRGALLRDVVNRLLDEPDLAEIVVVDDGSSDGSAAVLVELAQRHPRIVGVTSVDRQGQARARREGAQAARGEVLLSLDDDVLPRPGLPSAHQRHHARRTHAVVLGYMPPVTRNARANTSVALRTYATAYEHHCREYERDPETILTAFWGGNFSVRRSHYLRAVEGRDFAMHYHEDRDLGLRFRELGLTPIFDRSLRAEHLYERDLAAYLTDAWRSGADLCRLATLYPDVIGRFDPDSLIPEDSAATRLLARLSDRALAHDVLMALLPRAATIMDRARLTAPAYKCAEVAKHIRRRDGALGRHPVRSTADGSAGRLP